MTPESWSETADNITPDVLNELRIVDDLAVKLHARDDLMDAFNSEPRVVATILVARHPRSVNLAVSEGVVRVAEALMDAFGWCVVHDCDQEICADDQTPGCEWGERR